MTNEDTQFRITDLSTNNVGVGLVASMEPGVDRGGRPKGGDVEMILLSALPMGHSWRADGLSEARVIEQAAAMSDQPPVLVRRSDHLVVDGAHRVAAARRLGLHALPVSWFDGHALDVAEAFIERNRRLGLPPSGRDREALARWVLASEPFWSDRRVACVCGVSAKTVARHRSLTDVPGQEIERRIGRDGRARPARAGAVRERVVQALDTDPEASLRSIAGRLGVSPETVRSVRRSLRPGEQPSQPIRRSQDASDVVLAPPMPARALPQPWHDGSAFGSTDAGLSFVGWLDATNVPGSCWPLAGEVPLGRVYEVADEARRRSVFWADLATELDARGGSGGKGVQPARS